MRPRGTIIRRACRFSITAALLCLLAPTPGQSEESAPIARAFVYPIGNEQDFTKPAPGEFAGFHVSDPYLAVRRARNRRPQRVHYGVDLSAGSSGHVVRAIAAGVVDVSDGNALVKVRKAQTVKLPKVVDGKQVYAHATRYRTAYRWRTGWGNRVVIRHRLPNGDVVYSLYAHLLPRSVLVKKGEIVAAGQPIAKVGRTGRATAPHLHLEIRMNRIEESAEVADADEESDTDLADGEPAQTGVPHTVNPLAFLEDRVMRFEDLEPGSWQSRYALAAIKDGVMWGTKRRFDPDDSISRGAFYAALVSMFHMGTPFTKDEFRSNLDALVDAGILDETERSGQRAEDHVSRSDALELVLRCLDRRAAESPSLARIGTDQLANDFNVEFAGRDAAVTAALEARRLAAAETEARRKVAAAKAGRSAKEAAARGERARTKRAKRAKRAKVEPVKPVPILDPGFESLAQSTKNISRAEACLLLASAIRLGSSHLSALERAATRVTNSG
ncbi:MAG TPA: M23 family metallopeptidase [Candidatus Eisenbacteria bacterium]